jgi:hypothetical protein
VSFPLRALRPLGVVVRRLLLSPSLIISPLSLWYDTHGQGEASYPEGSLTTVRRL